MYTQPLNVKKLFNAELRPNKWRHRRRRGAETLQLPMGKQRGFDPKLRAHRARTPHSGENPN